MGGQNEGGNWSSGNLLRLPLSRGGGKSVYQYSLSKRKYVFKRSLTGKFYAIFCEMQERIQLIPKRRLFLWRPEKFWKTRNLLWSSWGNTSMMVSDHRVEKWLFAWSSAMMFLVFIRKQGRIHGIRCALYAYFPPWKISGDGPSDRRTDGHTLV